MKDPVDRKAQIREYKETPRAMGVFRVRNVPRRCSLVGITRDLPAMLNRQRFQLGMGGHPNRQLQLDWQEAGSEHFTFDVLDTLKPSAEPGYDPTDDLKALEAMWREKLAAEGERFYK